MKGKRKRAGPRQQDATDTGKRTHPPEKRSQEELRVYESAWGSLRTAGEPLGTKIPLTSELEKLRRSSWELDDSNWLTACTEELDAAGVETLRCSIPRLARRVMGLRDNAAPGAFFAMPNDLCPAELTALCATRGEGDNPSNPWLVTPKDDGTRTFLVYLRGKCFALLRDKPFFQELDPEAPFGDVPGLPFFLLLDAECVELVQHGEPSRSAAKKLHRVCDLLACNDRTYIGLPFAARLKLRDALLKHVLKDVQHPVLQTLLSKPFEPFHRLQHELLERTERRGGRWRCQDAHTGLGVPVDGFVFTRGDAPYRAGTQPGLRKWKFSPTVDLLLLKTAIAGEHGPRLVWGARFPLLQPAHDDPTDLHCEVFFDWALTTRPAAKLLLTYWAAWLGGGAREGASEPTATNPAANFYAPRHELDLIHPKAAFLPGAWAECKYVAAKGAWVPVEFFLEGMPLDQHADDSQKWPVRWHREPQAPPAPGPAPATATATAANPRPNTSTPQQVVQELLRQRRGLGGQRLFFRLCGVHEPPGAKGAKLGLAYAVPWTDLWWGGGGGGPSNARRTSSAQTRHAPNCPILHLPASQTGTHGSLLQEGSVWELGFQDNDDLQLLNVRHKDSGNFHTTVMQALRASAAKFSLDAFKKLIPAATPQAAPNAAANTRL